MLNVAIWIFGVVFIVADEKLDLIEGAVESG